MCEPADSTAGSVVLVVSNVFYLAAAGVAVYKRHLFLAALFGAVTFFSTVYHLCAAGFACLGGASCISLRLLDYIFAYFILAEIGLFVLMFYSLREKRWPLLLYATRLTLLGPAWLLIANDLFDGSSTTISWNAGIWLGASLAFAFFVKLLFRDKGRLDFGAYRIKNYWWAALIALALGVVAIVLFVLDDEEISLAQDLIHSAWHATGALAAIALFFAIRRDPTLEELCAQIEAEKEQSKKAANSRLSLLIHGPRRFYRPGGARGLAGARKNKRPRL